MIRKPTTSLFLVLCLFIFIHLSLSGQSKHWKTGLVIGMNISNYDEGRFDKFDFFYPGTGYAMGLTTSYSISKDLNISIEAHYSYRVSKEKYLDNENPFFDYAISDFRLNQSFISVPITLNYAFNRLNIQVGLFGDRRLKTETSGQPKNIGLNAFPFQKDYSGGFLIGGHYDFYNFEIGLRNFYGLTNHEKTVYSEGGIMNDIELYKTRNFQFYIIYHIL